MAQRSIPAVMMRGGTSKGLLFHAADLPAHREEWTTLLCGAFGSPDEYGRQLNGVGGGLSSLSKACVVAPSSREDADVDYTFVQVLIGEARVDFRANCGNMSSAVGPFAFDEGLVTSGPGRCVVRIHNTNTDKRIHSTFDVEEAATRYDGDFTIPGVGGSGAPIRLDFLDPGGATTGQLLPTGRVSEWIEVTGLGSVEVSLVDAANAVVFVRARDVGLSGRELPSEIEARSDVLARCEALRRSASVRMGIAPDEVAAARTTSVPFVCLVGEPEDAATLSGRVLVARDIDVLARVISNGQPHRALPLTVSLCTAVAARLDGSVVAQVLRSSAEGALRLGMPSGILSVDATVERRDGHWNASKGTFFRTARRLFDGRVWVP